jgi:hypothetical protein
MKPERIYRENGLKITVYPYQAPKRHQRTFPMVKGSIANLGAKAVSLSEVGLTKHKHG